MEEDGGSGLSRPSGFIEVSERRKTFFFLKNLSYTIVEFTLDMLTFSLCGFIMSVVCSLTC